MKRRTTIKTILLGLLILVVSSSMSFARSYKYSKQYEVKERYKATEEVTMNLNVQYTDLKILSNDTSNEIYLICKIELKSNNESYVDNPWENITIDHSMSENIFDLKIRYSKKNNKGSCNFKIKCFLYVPKNYNSDIVTQFSDLEINAPTNKPLKLTAQHSDVELNTPFTNVTLNSQYSDIEAKRIDHLDAIVQYSEFSVDVLGDIECKNLQYSELEIKELRGSFRGRSQYSEVEVMCSSSSTGFDCGLQYSELKLEFDNYRPNISGTVKSSFSEINASGLEFISSSANNLCSGSKVDCEIRSKNFSSGSDVFSLKLNSMYSTITVK